MVGMSEKVPQTYANHSKLDPLFHFFLLPMLGVNLILQVKWTIQNSAPSALWQCVLAVALVAAAFKIRLYALKVQDRVIRLEERMRLSTVLSEPLRSRIGELNESQLVGLRFASDSELPGMVEQTLAQGWTNKQIKQAIQNWRPDYYRV